LEEIDGKFYLVVGTKRETQDEYIVSLDLIEKSGLKADFERWYQGLEALPLSPQRNRP